MLLDRHGLRAKKSFGQNFLMDVQLSAKIADLACTPRGGSVIEIGAGTGALTRPLLARAERVLAIERDRELLPLLEGEFATELASGQLGLFELDAKSCDWLALLKDSPKPHVIAGNLPYQITGPLLQKVSAISGELARAVFLVQLEVAERLSAEPGGRDYGALTVFVQNQFEVRRAFVIRRGAFFPQPGVDSAVVVLTPRTAPVAVESPLFQQVVRAAFAQRRKTLRNAWRSLPGTSDELLASAALRAGIDLSLRGEVLSVFAFARMTRELES